MEPAQQGDTGSQGGDGADVQSWLENVQRQPGFPGTLANPNSSWNESFLLALWADSMDGLGQEFENPFARIPSDSDSSTLLNQPPWKRLVHFFRSA